MKMKKKIFSTVVRQKKLLNKKILTIKKKNTEKVDYSKMKIFCQAKKHIEREKYKLQSEKR